MTLYLSDKYKHDESTKRDTSLFENEIDKYVLLLYNDDFNTFEHVIECLIKICKHDILQAEQCATIAHYKGKCPVKTGKLNTLKVHESKLLRYGLEVEIVQL